MKKGKMKLKTHSFWENKGRPSAAHTKVAGRLRRPATFVCPLFLEKLFFTFISPFCHLLCSMWSCPFLQKPFSTFFRPFCHTHKKGPEIGPVPFFDLFFNIARSAQCSCRAKPGHMAMAHPMHGHGAATLSSKAETNGMLPFPANE